MPSLFELAPRDAGPLLDELEVEFAEQVASHAIQDCAPTNYCNDASRICWTSS